MPVETKFLRLRQPVELGDRINGWRVCWLGGCASTLIRPTAICDRSRK